MVVGNALRQWLKTNNWTSRQLAAAAEMQESHVSKILNNKNSPSAATLAAFLRAGVDINWLLTTADQEVV